jgi:hypothetical protein
VELDCGSVLAHALRAGRGVESKTGNIYRFGSRFGGNSDKFGFLQQSRELDFYSRAANCRAVCGAANCRAVCGANGWENAHNRETWHTAHKMKSPVKPVAPFLTEIFVMYYEFGYKRVLYTWGKLSSADSQNIVARTRKKVTFTRVMLAKKQFMARREIGGMQREQ